MLKQNVYLGSVKSLSPSGEILAAQPLPQQETFVTVNLEDDRTGLLDLSYPRAAVWVKMIDYLRKHNRPIYVEIDPDTRIITKFCAPEAARVLKITPGGGDVVYVAFHTASARYYIRCNHPDYHRMLNDLQAALDTGSTIMITATLHENEIIDVRPLPDPFGMDEPPGPPAPPVPDPPVSWDRAVELFNLMNSHSCPPCHSTGTSCISFKYPRNGCQIRAHLMSYLMTDLGETPEKIWLDGWLDVATANDPNCQLSWNWHVAPTLMVEQTSGPDIRMVIDPSLCTEPVMVDDWKSAQGDPSATYITSPWQQYEHDSPFSTASQATADDHMEWYRQLLDDWCAMYGPSPYACPIDRKCFFIVDRSTFSNDEIDAMIHVANPAEIEAAFFVVVDGFSPEELGITSSDLTGIPTIKPDLTFPAVAQMDIDVMANIGLEDFDHLSRRQRITWKYKITFTGSAGFVSEQQEVLFTASIESVSGNASIYLIRQPNPFEVDGATCWLSTDLRVFQIKAEASRFEETMHADASVFIGNVLDRLNNGTSGVDTFEGISIDQQTSWLELSQSVEVSGSEIPVYNFAVAKVRYRALVNPAPNVRVFFRLFPASSTSLEFNPDTTYRRIVHEGVTKPLLGIINDDVVTIPCFAAPRVNNTTTSMIEQQDDKNVKEIPPNATGHEVVMYFGCWLDFNQEQARFPYSPGLNNGPYAAADQVSIQEHIRNEHQCLVAEIAFDPAPIPSSATPAVSDKLAQRNLAIIRSDNPGKFASHRIPHTFEIRPTRTQLAPGDPVDELMIDWGNTPEGSLANIYLPGADTNEILKLAAKMYRSQALTRITAHILQCRAGGVNYIPIPQAQGSNYAGMISIDLPETVKKGQVFTIVVRQVTGGARRTTVTHVVGDGAAVSRERRILGAFQITIPVVDKEVLLEPEARLLSNLRWIERAIPVNNRWYPVFTRYVGQIAGRVDALGGDSSQVAASPSGNWRRINSLCRSFALLLGLLIAAFFTAIGALPLPVSGFVLVPIAALLAWAARVWIKRCRPCLCKWLKILITGSGLAVIILALLALLGMSTPKLIVTLVVSAGVTLGAAIMGWLRRCF